MKKIFKKIILMISLISFNLYASSSIYMNTIDRQHYIARNQANGEEARIKALKLCIETTGSAKKCKLIYKTDYGGYGAIAIGDKSQGYSYGARSQEISEEVSVRNCTKRSTPSTCRVVTRWKDEGKIIAVYHGNAMQNNNANANCGINGANGLAINCNTGTDVNGNFNGWNNGIAITPNGRLDIRPGR
jgi:hypothetical protein